MRSNEQHLLDMLLAARKVQRYVEDLTQESFVRSDLHQSAVIRELQVIGEAARQITLDNKTRYATIDWVKISACVIGWCMNISV